MILLMEEILNHLGCINLVKNGINYLPTGAGFLPSPVSPLLRGQHKLLSYKEQVAEIRCRKAGLRRWEACKPCRTHLFNLIYMVP